MNRLKLPKLCLEHIDIWSWNLPRDSQACYHHTTARPWLIDWLIKWSIFSINSGTDSQDCPGTGEPTSSTLNLAQLLIISQRIGGSCLCPLYSRLLHMRLRRAWRVLTCCVQGDWRPQVGLTLSIGVLRLAKNASGCKNNWNSRSIHCTVAYFCATSVA